MFTPIAPEIAKRMKREGYMKFFVLKDWDFVALHELFISVPHKIVYVKREHPDSHRLLFNCTLSVKSYSFVVDNITLAREMPMSRAVEYLFLEMTFEAAEGLAEVGATLNKRRRLVLSSELPTFSEIASERNFKIRRTECTDYYRAIKIFEPEKEGIHKNEKND